VPRLRSHRANPERCMSYMYRLTCIFRMFHVPNRRRLWSSMYVLSASTSSIDNTYASRPAQRSSVAQPSGPPSPAERPRTKDTNGSPNCSVLGPLRSCFGDFDDLTRPLSDGGAPSAPAAREPAATEPRKNHLFHTNAVYDSSSGSDGALPLPATTIVLKCRGDRCLGSKVVLPHTSSCRFACSILMNL
jgi:hypothetical protein